MKVITKSTRVPNPMTIKRVISKANKGRQSRQRESLLLMAEESLVVMADFDLIDLLYKRRILLLMFKVFYGLEL